MTILERIQEVIDRKLVKTQQEWGEAAGYDKSYIGSLKNQLKNAKIKSFGTPERVARSAGVHRDWLLFGTGPCVDSRGRVKFDEHGTVDKDLPWPAEAILDDEVWALRNKPIAEPVDWKSKLLTVALTAKWQNLRQAVAEVVGVRKIDEKAFDVLMPIVQASFGQMSDKLVEEWRGDLLSAVDGERKDLGKYGLGSGTADEDYDPAPKKTVARRV